MRESKNIVAAFIVFLFVLRAIVQCEEKLTISASWAKDEDISRLLQSLPNWANMAQPRQTRQKREDEEDFTRYTCQDTLPAYAPAYINCLRWSPIGACAQTSTATSACAPCTNTNKRAARRTGTHTWAVRPLIRRPVADPLFACY